MTPVSIDVFEWPISLHLAALASFDDPPGLLPTEVLTAEFRANKNGIAFGSMGPKPAKWKVHTFSIAEVALDVSYEWGKGSGGGSFNGVFVIKAPLQQPKGAKFSWPTQLFGTVAYTSSPSQWTLSGSGIGLTAAWMDSCRRTAPMWTHTDRNPKVSVWNISTSPIIIMSRGHPLSTSLGSWSLVYTGSPSTSTALRTAGTSLPPPSQTKIIMSSRRWVTSSPALLVTR